MKQSRFSSFDLLPVREMEMEKIKHIDEVENIKNAPDDTKVWVTLGALREAIEVAKEMGRKEAEAKLRKEYESRTLDKRQILELVAAS